jgi:hypothetical protein
MDKLKINKVPSQDICSNCARYQKQITRLGAVVVLVLMIGAPAVFAETPFQSGFEHGVSDAKASCTDRCHWYILEPGKGFQFHTWEFAHGYVAGFCSIAGSQMSSDDDAAGWDCARGPESAFWVGNN